MPTTRQPKAMEAHRGRVSSVTPTRSCTTPASTLRGATTASSRQRRWEAIEPMIHDAGPALDAETKEKVTSRPATSAGWRCRQRMRTNESTPRIGSPTSHHRTTGSVGRSAAPISGTPHATRLMSAARA
jgi:hypothetical protein